MRKLLLPFGLFFAALTGNAHANFLSAQDLASWCNQGISLGYVIGVHDGFELSQAINERSPMCTDGLSAAQLNESVCQYLSDHPRVIDDRDAATVVTAAMLMTAC